MSKPRNHFDTSTETKENQRELARISKIKFTQKDLNRLMPMTFSQEKFVKAYNQNIKTIFQTGYPGVGKTAMALSEAFNEILDPNSNLKRVVIIRSAVQGRQIGFTTGDVDEKGAPYEDPYVEIIDSIFKFNSSYNNLKAVGLLEFRLSTFLRGVNLKDCVVVVDELQNMDFEELDTIFTRMSGTSSRIIFCGDRAQCDLQRTREKSGIDKFISIFESMHLFQDDYDDYSLLLPHVFLEDTEQEKNTPNYEHIEYSPKECIRNKEVRKYLIAKTKLGL